MLFNRKSKLWKFYFIFCCYLTSRRLVSSSDVTASFHGNEFVEYQITNDIVTSKDKVTLDFKTTAAYGILLYSCGIQGDFLLLEIKRGKILYTGNFGAAYEESGSHQIILDKQYNDNKWHSVTLLRENGTHVYLTVDDVTNSRVKTDTDFEQLNLDTYLYVGGVGKEQKENKNCNDISEKKSFDGCLSKVRFNSIDLLYGASEKFTGYKTYGNVKFECESQNDFNIFGFHSESSLLKVKRNILIKNELNFTIGFRTFEPNGHLATHLCTNGAVNIDVVKGKLRLTLSFLATNDAVRIVSDVKTDDGDWHILSVSVKRTEGLVRLSVDDDSHIYKFKEHFKLDKELGLFMSEIRFGGNTPELPGLVSCFRTIFIGQKYVDYNSTSIILKRDVLDQCQVKDLCYPNPCLHGSTCTQSRSKYTCDCTGTEYEGRNCERCIYKTSCEDLRRSGETKSGTYSICPNNERISKVYCDMESGATVVKHNIRNDTRVGDGTIIASSMISFYVHSLTYDVSKEGITDLMKVSISCRQYIRYDCYHSRLLFDVGRYKHVHYKGGRWVSRDAEIQHYWGGATPESMKCGCGMDGSCAKDTTGRKKDCNCDVGDATWRHDDGFLTDKKTLPVSEVQFSIGPETFEKSLFSVGFLQCFGEIPKPTTKPPPTFPKTKPLNPTQIGEDMFFNITRRVMKDENGTIIIESVKDENLDSLFSRPWLITIVIVGALLCLLLVFLMFLLFRQQVTDILIKCIYGNKITKPRIEIEEYNRYSTATEENSDWDIYRLSTTFPTSTPEPSYCLTDDESVNMRIRTLEDVREKKRFRKLGNWGSRTVSAPTVVGSLKSLRSSKREKHDKIAVLEERQGSSECSSKPYESSFPSSDQNGSLKTFGSLETDQALSTTATDGERDSFVDSNSEYSHKSSEHSNASSLKESECSTKVNPPTSLNIRRNEDESKNKRVHSVPVTNYQKVNGFNHRNGKTIYTDPIKAYYPILPVNGYVPHRQPILRTHHGVEYTPHVFVGNPNGRYTPANGARFIPVARRPSANSDHFPINNHPTIHERSEESEEDENFPGRYANEYFDSSRNSYEFYEGDHDSPTSETRLLLNDINSREECEREADEQIKLLKQKVIQKATECA